MALACVILGPGCRRSTKQTLAPGDGSGSSLVRYGVGRGWSKGGCRRPDSANANGRKGVGERGAPGVRVGLARRSVLGGLLVTSLCVREVCGVWSCVGRTGRVRRWTLRGTGAGDGPFPFLVDLVIAVGGGRRGQDDGEPLFQVLQLRAPAGFAFLRCFAGLACCLLGAWCLLRMLGGLSVVQWLSRTVEC